MIVVLGSMVLALFLSAPGHEQFWWTDAATIALNGDLVRDYVANGLGRNPQSFANEWFLRYPALTISLYPPLFPTFEAAAFATFGFSQSVAQATVAAFAAVAACGATAMARTAMPLLPAAAVALALFATPATLLWSRQIMLETPTLAFLLLATTALLHYQAKPGTARLLLAVGLAVAAIYTKQTAIFIAPAFAAALLIDEGTRLLRRTSVWLATCLGVLSLVPLAVFTLKFTPALSDIAASHAEGGEAARVSLGSLTAYGRALPGIVGWPSLAASAAYLALALLRGWPTRTERRLAVAMLCWFAADYAFVSFVGHFELRYGMMLSVPPACFTILLIARFASGLSQKLLAASVGIALFILALVANPVPWVSSNGAVAAEVLANAAQDDIVLFDADDSKSFVFSLRARSPSPRVYVLRAEKLLVDYSIVREWGIHDRNLSTADIAALIDRAGVDLVVLQPGFWSDQPSMARLEAYVRSDRFEQIGEFHIEAQERHRNVSLEVFRNRHPTHPTAETIQELAARH